MGPLQEWYQCAQILPQASCAGPKTASPMCPVNLLPMCPVSTQHRPLPSTPFVILAQSLPRTAIRGVGELKNRYFVFLAVAGI